VGLSGDRRLRNVLDNRFAGLADVCQNLARAHGGAGKRAELQQDAFRSRFQFRHGFVGFDVS
jgi:hypothetical protein